MEENKDKTQEKKKLNDKESDKISAGMMNTNPNFRRDKEQRPTSKK